MSLIRSKITSIRARVGNGFVSKDPHPEDQNRDVAVMRNIVNTMEEAQNMTQSAAVPGIDPIKVAPPALSVTEALGRNNASNVDALLPDLNFVDPNVAFMKDIVTTLKDAEFDAGQEADNIRDSVLAFMDNLTTADCETFSRDLRVAMDSVILNRLTANEEDNTSGYSNREINQALDFTRTAEEMREDLSGIAKRLDDLMSSIKRGRL